MHGDEITLSAVGVTAPEERTYRALLRRRTATPSEIARDLGVAAGRARAQLEELETKGFVSRTPGRVVRFVAAPPDVAVEASIHRQLGQIEQARMSALRLAEEFRSGTATSTPVEVVEVVLGREAMLQRWAQVQQIAVKELVAFDTPPYSRPPAEINVDEEVALNQGVGYRIIYSREALEYPGMLPHIERYMAAGEDARVLADLPMKLDIADRKLGLIPLSIGDPGRIEGGLLVHPSPLLETLAFLFETLWERAVPLRVALGSEGPAVWERDAVLEYQQLLPLLASGLKDEAIARQLGVAVRTVHRRVASLMEELGAQTRYQAGLQAARRGWYE